MRKILVAMALSCLVVAAAAAPAGAPVLHGTSCRSGNGTATFVPALPKVGSSTKVTPTIKVTGKIGACSGGNVTSATFHLSAKPQHSMNCVTLRAGSYTAGGTDHLTWNTQSTSTVTFNLHGVKGQVPTASVSGSVTAGPFHGMTFSQLITYKLGNGACATKPLTTATVGVSQTHIAGTS